MQAAEINQSLRNKLAHARISGRRLHQFPNLKGRHRWQIIVKTKREISHLLTDLPRQDGTVTVTVDPDPLFLL